MNSYEGNNMLFVSLREQHGKRVKTVYYKAGIYAVN